MIKRRVWPYYGLVGLLAALAAVTGCTIDSADSVHPNVQIKVAGVYENNGSRVVSQHTGAAILSLNVIQDGSSLQAIDNNGLIFRGTIGSATIESATFTLEGQTTTGQEGVISGSFTADGSTVTMRGTWAEPSTFGTVYAVATGVPQQPDPPNGNGDGNGDDNGTDPVETNGVSVAIT